MSLGFPQPQSVLPTALCSLICLIVASVSLSDHRIGRAESQNAARPILEVSGVVPSKLVTLAHPLRMSVEISTNIVAYLLRTLHFPRGLRQRGQDRLGLAGCNQLPRLRPPGDGLEDGERDEDKLERHVDGGFMGMSD